MKLLKHKTQTCPNLTGSVSTPHSYFVSIWNVTANLHHYNFTKIHQSSSLKSFLSFDQRVPLWYLLSGLSKDTLNRIWRFCSPQRIHFRCCKSVKRNDLFIRSTWFVRISPLELERSTCLWKYIFIHHVAFSAACLVFISCIYILLKIFFSGGKSTQIIYLSISSNTKE